MNTVSGLQSALKLCASDKVKDRSQGQEHVREIFSNRENLAAFQETASRDGGAGWVAFFQCLFQVVVVEKKAAVKKGDSAQGGSKSSPTQRSSILVMYVRLELADRQMKGRVTRNEADVTDCRLHVPLLPP